jgi:hypothetical protein
LRVVTQVDLMDVVGRYNLVRRTTRPAPEARRWLQGEREEWLAVHQETGPIDLRFERVGDRSLGPMVAVASGEASLRARVAELVAREEQITAERHESAASAPEPDAAE